MMKNILLGKHRVQEYLCPLTLWNEHFFFSLVFIFLMLPKTLGDSYKKGLETDAVGYPDLKEFLSLVSVFMSQI